MAVLLDGDLKYEPLFCRWFIMGSEEIRISGPSYGNAGSTLKVGVDRSRGDPNKDLWKTRYSRPSGKPDGL